MKIHERKGVLDPRLGGPDAIQTEGPGTSAAPSNGGSDQVSVSDIGRELARLRAEVGDVVVDHPKTRYVAFTGSKEVGLRINERAAKVNEGQIWIKRVVAEMGGKDAVIVADDANLDDAATGVVQAAFGFQGQKCSACSRASESASGTRSGW